MTTYYIDHTNGSDSNNGLGPDASSGTNKPWATIGKALVSGSPVVGGDTIYLAPGICRQTTTATIAITPSSTVNIFGDPGNAQGFKTSGSVLVSPGPVIISLWSSDTATSAVSIVFNNKGQHLNWQYIAFENSADVLFDMSTALTSSNNGTWTDCAFDGGHSSILQITVGFGVAANLTFDRCQFIGRNTLFQTTYTQGTGSDYDANIVFTNSSFVAGATCISLAATGSGANLGNGVHCKNCTFVNQIACLCSTASVSTTFPSTFLNNVIYCGTGLSANTTGQMTEDYNSFSCGTSRTNVSTGTHSSTANNLRVHYGQERIWGMVPRPFFEPLAGSPTLGFNNDGTQSTYDGLNRPRLSGGAQTAAGWLGRGNTAAQGTSPAPPSGTFTWQATGPWYQDFVLPVSNQAHTVSIVTQHDASYTGTKPQLLILNGTDVGVSNQTITDTGGSGSWNTLTTGSFTPTAVGTVTVRLVSGDTSGVSVVEFANLTVT